ncbi:hypothetical protein ACFFX0_12225 [Citricoccus parietis]|uniref:Uncharacterized protein n=1 Tax=Citricoccus parietis TaxID=592307 RepID=A0ABV5FZ27_9MICC
MPSTRWSTSRPTRPMTSGRCGWPATRPPCRPGPPCLPGTCSASAGRR